MRAPVASRTARDLFGVTGEPALRGDEFSAFTAGVSDRPATGAFQVVWVSSLGHAEIHEEGANGVGADEQIAAGKTLIPFIVLKLIRVHRKNSGELSR